MFPIWRLILFRLLAQRALTHIKQEKRGILIIQNTIIIIEGLPGLQNVHSQNGVDHLPSELGLPNGEHR